jgi:hypothetical protein
MRFRMLDSKETGEYKNREKDSPVIREDQNE